MPFTTDQQTLDDLNIFGVRGGDSIYGIFNRTHTRGGAALMEACFRYPLSDDLSINRRSAVIRRLAMTGAGFPFKPELFDQAEQYLANRDERTRLTGSERGLVDRVSGMVAADNEYKVIYKGVVALIGILQSFASFEGPEGLDKPAGVLDEAALSPLFSETLKGKLSYEKVALYDGVLRFRCREVIGRLLQWIYQLDMYISVARVAAGRGYAFARALPEEEPVIRIEGCYHPQVKHAVANTLIAGGQGNVIFLTGANMAGKSTFMKSLGIALFLAHMGFPVPAASMEFSVRDAVYTTINLPDNLGMGASHFYAEVLRVKKIARELGEGKRLFVIFDELFRGTNVKDAYEATVELVTAFAGRVDSTFVISTHIIEAGDVLRERCPGIRFCYLPTRLVDGRPVYSYTLEEGITDDRHGMVIIDNEGILEILARGKPGRVAL